MKALPRFAPGMKWSDLSASDMQAIVDTLRAVAALKGDGKILVTQSESGYTIRLADQPRVAVAVPDALPPVPDPDKDYMLFYNGTTQEIEWIETTATCPEF